MDNRQQQSQRVCEALSIDVVAASRVRVLVITGYGLNCEEETTAGFEMLGSQVDALHLSELLQREQKRLGDYRIVVIIGGFSFGDHVASGRILANRMRYRLNESFCQYIANGGLVLGICNGFQVLTNLGLVPGSVLGRGPLVPSSEQRKFRIGTQTTSLVPNEPLGYRNAWTRLRVDSLSPCVFTQGIETLECPIRHAQGRLVFADEAQRDAINSAHLIPVRYADQSWNPTEEWPDNPNGSLGGAAGLCDPSGRVFGIMPHPEAYLYPQSHPRWIAQRDNGTLPSFGQGLRILANGVRAAIES